MWQKLRIWWQIRTGEDDTPFDTDVPAWLTSLALHTCLLLLVTVLTFHGPSIPPGLTLLVPLEDEEEMSEMAPEEFEFNELELSDPGANSDDGADVAISFAPELGVVTEVPSSQLAESEMAQFELREMIDQVTGLNQSETLVVKGAAGVGTRGAAGAVDRLTQEILMSLDDRDTLVVWLFDQSGSLTLQREAVHNRLDQVYLELGVATRKDGNPKAGLRQYPLLSAVMAFGQHVAWATDEPTPDVEAIKKAVRAIPEDDSGVENVFTAVSAAVDRYHKYRRVGSDKKPIRNVMLIVFSDEVGDDQQLLDATVDQCHKFTIPVYVVGVPAPFGKRETLVKWVDPDPTYDQTPQFGLVNQGPESYQPEVVQLGFLGEGENETPTIDSGFGPYALTRLCYETGGIYFAVHPNRNAGRRVRPYETAAFSAHLDYFFSPEVMASYRPDYVSSRKYQQSIIKSRMRTALVRAAQQSWLAPFESPQLRFVSRSEAELSNVLTESQKSAAKLSPKVQTLLQTLKAGEADRDAEDSLRWKAGYDLAMGRTLATAVRTDGYNAMLAMAKRGMKFKNEKNNTWLLRPANEVSGVGSQLQDMAEKAQVYLQKVVDEHPNTPWALLAQRELGTPLGWDWQEGFTPLPKPREEMAGNNNPDPTDDQKRMLEKPKPRRNVPKL